ncbi:MAG: undecaprenyl-diphosphate phosphatase [Pseudomonadota bacterium]
MEWWQALCLALVQGLTEFLPISSSAHLVLPSLLLGWPDQGVAFDVAVHFGTLTAVVLYFRRDLIDLAVGALGGVTARRMNDELREVGFLIVATVPAIVAGIALNSVMDDLRSVAVIATTTLVFGLLLGVADRRVVANAAPAVHSWGVALVIGLAQAIAPIPGTSRSGITITAGLLLGLSRAAAARFSFLMSIPVIAGAALLKLLELLETPLGVDWTLLGAATGLAAVSAYSCIALFLRLIERIGMMPFVVYRLILGLVLVAVWWLARAP